MIPKQKVTEKYILAQMQKTQSDTHNTECKLWSKSFNPEPKDVKGLAQGSHALIYLKIHFQF